MNLIDRYIIKQFINTLLFSVMVLYVIFLIVDLLENLDDFLDNGVKFIIILKYYLYFFPEILKILTPVAMLLSTLFTVGKLSTNNEITAFKTGGMSLYRLMMPFFVLSVGISFGHLYFNGWIVPKTSAEKIKIQQIYLRKNLDEGALYSLNFREDPLKNLSISTYNPIIKSGSFVGIDEFTSEQKPRLVKRTEAEEIKWDSISKVWILKNVLIRDFSNNQILTKRLKEMKYESKIKHEQIMQFNKSTDEMTYDEMQKYINSLKNGGRDVRKEMTDYYGNYAYPFANLIVIMFGVPFASVKRKGGIAVQIGAALVISFVYLILTKVSQTIGYSSDFDPLVSAWMANIAFAILGLVVLFKTRT